jgi:hypothetical protein
MPRSPWQFPKLAPVIVANAPLSTVTLNVVAVHVDPIPAAGTENPKLPDSIRPSVVPTGDQLAAVATDGNRNAHDANAALKSSMLFFETIFNITNTPD